MLNRQCVAVLIPFFLNQQVQHKNAYGGSWRYGLDIVAHCDTVAISTRALASWCFAALAALRSTGTYRPGRVRPVLGSSTGRKKSARAEAVRRSKVHSTKHAQLVGEDEQLRIYGNKNVRFKGKIDPVINGIFKQWRKSKYRHYAMEGPILLSKACRGLVSVDVCRKIIGDTNNNGRIILGGHGELIVKNLSRVYNEVVRRNEEHRFYRDILCGPEDGAGISAYKRHLHVKSRKIKGKKSKSSDAYYRKDKAKRKDKRKVTPAV